MTTKQKSSKSPRLVLASASPRRSQLLAGEGFRAEVIPATIDEPSHVGSTLSPCELAEAISFFKARSVADGLTEGIVIGGDTVVALGPKIFGKPSDRDHARRTLRELSGTTQEVITGVSLVCAATHRRMIRHAITRVTMRAIPPEELEAYLDTGEWEGKAGAYGIQDSADAFVTRVEGSFTNVVGLPVELITEMLASWGVTPD